MIRNWFRPPRHVLAIFVAVAVVSAGALAYPMMLLIQQNKALEVQRRQDHLDQAADRALTMMQGALSDIEGQLGARVVPASKLPVNVLMLHVGTDGIMVQPKDRLLYYPTPPQRIEAPDPQFAEPEHMEFARNDKLAAAQMYLRLAANSDIGVRAGALARLARVQRMMHPPSDAIHTYDELSQISGAGVFGLPVELVAHEGRASAFEEMHRDSDLHTAAAALHSGLQSGQWQLTKSEYEYYSADAKSWLGKSNAPDDPDEIARAEAVAWLWENRATVVPGTRRLIQAGGRPALILSQSDYDGFIAAVAGPTYLASLCREAVPEAGLQCVLSDSDGHAVMGAVPPARFAIRTTSMSKLPWTLQIFSTADTGAASTSPQGRLLWWVAVVLAGVWCTGAAFIVRAIQREARAAQLQSDFVAAVSHEFRSPLTSLGQISEMLALDRFETEQLRRQSYDVLVRETGRLRRLVEGLLDFGRFEAGASIYHFEPLELGVFVKTIVADFQQRIAAAGYTIVLREPQHEAYVKADREALSRAVCNLLDNAVKYSPECHTVWVEIGCEQNRVLIVVRDEGLGIPVAEQSEIFERFVRGTDSKARRIKGTGIGLAMVRHIVEAHGGEIKLVSQPGEGSRFTVVLPQGLNS